LGKDPASQKKKTSSNLNGQVEGTSDAGKPGQPIPPQEGEDEPAPASSLCVAAVDPLEFHWKLDTKAPVVSICWHPTRNILAYACESDLSALTPVEAARSIATHIGYSVKISSSNSEREDIHSIVGLVTIE